MTLKQGLILLSGGAGALVIQYFFAPTLTGLINGFFGRNQKKIDAAAIVSAKTAVDGTMMLTELFERVGLLEENQKELQAKSTRLAGLLNRVCWAYEGMRKLLMTIVRYLRADKPVPPELLDEAEATPTRVDLIKQATEDIT